jgi:general secretion pathway protein I
VKQRGFTLLEVMIALAILGAALVVLLRLGIADVQATARAKMLSIATGLARSKMYDIEEDLLQTGFQDTDACPLTTMPCDGDFADDGQPKFTWKAVIEKVELPPVQKLTEGMDSTSATTTPDPAAKDPAADLGLTGAAGTGAAMVQMYFPLVQPVLEQAIRKVTLTISWKVGKYEEKFDVICFFTDTKAIDQAAALTGALGGGTGGPGGAGGVAPGGNVTR